MQVSAPALGLCALLFTGSPACGADDPAPADTDSTLIGDQARAARDAVRQNAGQVADAAREGAQQAATAARQVARQAARSAREGVQQAAASTRKGVRKLKTAVRGEQPPARPGPDTPDP